MRVTPQAESSVMWLGEHTTRGRAKGIWVPLASGASCATYKGTFERAFAWYRQRHWSTKKERMLPKERPMQTFNVHIYRAMGLFFSGIAARMNLTGTLQPRPVTT